MTHSSSDSYFAEWLIVDYGKDLTYLDARAEWLTWTGARWRPDTSGALHRYLNKTFDKLGRELFQEYPNKLPHHDPT